MVTGDQLAIGIETAKRLKMGELSCCIGLMLALVHNSGPNLIIDKRQNAGTEFIEGTELMRDDMSDTELGQKILQVSGFAGVYPEHKHRIVQALQARGMLVGMTGMPIPV